MERKYPKSITKERTVVAKYIIDMLVVLSPIGLQPDKNNIKNRHIISDIKDLFLIYVISSTIFAFYSYPIPQSHTFSHTFFKKTSFPILNLFKSMGTFLLICIKMWI